MRAALLFGLLMVVGCEFKATPAPVAEKKESRKWERNEFKKLVMGKTQEEVISLIGKPTRTHNYQDEISFTYEEVTYDKITGKTDYIIYLRFGKDGKLERITF